MSFDSLDYLYSLELVLFDIKDNYCVVSVTYISDTIFSTSKSFSLSLVYKSVPLGKLFNLEE
jgi:hypothetical protein